MPRLPDPPGAIEVDVALPSLALTGIELLRPLAKYEQVTEGGW